MPIPFITKRAVIKSIARPKIVHEQANLFSYKFKTAAGGQSPNAAQVSAQTDSSFSLYVSPIVRCRPRISHESKFAHLQREIAKQAGGRGVGSGEQGTEIPVEPPAVRAAAAAKGGKKKKNQTPKISREAARSAAEAASMHVEEADRDAAMFEPAARDAAAQAALYGVDADTGRARMAPLDPAKFPTLRDAALSVIPSYLQVVPGGHGPAGMWTDVGEASKVFLFHVEVVSLDDADLAGEKELLWRTKDEWLALEEPGFAEVVRTATHFDTVVLDA